MGANNSLLAASFLSQGVASIGNSVAQANAQKAQALYAKEIGNYQGDMLETNARLTKMSADDALKAGAEEAGAVRRKGMRVRGAQRVAAAAAGIEMDSGSAAQVQAETEFLSAQDELKVRSNAWRAAWGYRVEEQNLKTQAKMARLQGRMGYQSGMFQASNTLLTGGINAASAGLQAAYYGAGGSKLSKDT